jgi:hypothetical protein
MAGLARRLRPGATAACGVIEPHTRHLWGEMNTIACPGVDQPADPGPTLSGLVVEPGDVLLLGVGDVRIPRDQAEALRSAVLGACPGLVDVLFLPGAGTAVYRVQGCHHVPA